MQQIGPVLVAYPVVMAIGWMLLAVLFVVRREGRQRWLRQPPDGPHPGVSVLIPCFNEAATLDETLRHALAVHWPQLEVIAIDDGSSDGTGERLDGWAAVEPRLRVVHLARNQGKAMALRTGALLARQDEQRLEHAQPVNLSRLLQDQLDLNLDAITLRRQALAVDITPQLLVQGQPLLLQRLFRNLIDNAMRYTPPEGQLSVQARRRGDQVLVAVADTGIGLSREQMSQVFDRFWRASPDRSDGGTGLGLAIASQICQAHGGRILVTSQPGQGSCFEVELPLLQGT